MVVAVLLHFKHASLQTTVVKSAEMKFKVSGKIQCFKEIGVGINVFFFFFFGGGGGGGGGGELVRSTHVHIECVRTDIHVLV